MDGTQWHLKAHIIESCLRTKVLVPRNGQWSGLSPCCPPQVPTSCRETWPFSRGEAQSPRRLQGRKCLSSFCPWHSPGMDRPRAWTYCVFLVPWLSTPSPLLTLVVTEWKISSLFPCVWPQDRQTQLPHVSHLPASETLNFIVPGEWRDDSRMARIVMSLCFSITAVIFLLSPPKEDAFVLQLAVLPDPTDLRRNSIVVLTRASVS